MLRQHGARGVRKARKLQALLHQRIRCQRATAAGRRHDGHLADLVTHVAPHGIGEQQHRTHITHEGHALFAAHRFEHRVIARHAGGVRERGGAACARTSGLHRQPGLARSHRAARCGSKTLRAFHSLYVRTDHLGGGVVDEKVDKIAKLQIGLIAYRKPVREPTTHGPRAIEVRGHECATLAHETNGPGRQLIDLQNRRGTQHQLVRRTDHAQTIRTDHAHPVAVANVEQFALAAQTHLSRIGEPGRDHQRAATAQTTRLLDLPEHLVCRHGEHHQIGPLIQLLERWVRLDAKELLAPRIDRQHLARKAMLEQHAEQAASKLGLVFRRAHHRNRCRGKDLRHGRFFHVSVFCFLHHCRHVAASCFDPCGLTY